MLELRRIPAKVKIELGNSQPAVKVKKRKIREKRCVTSKKERGSEKN